MKTKKLLFFALLCATIVYLQSCNEEDYPTYYMDEDFKDYVMHPVGSYWIYEDSISGAIDSVILLDQQVGIYTRREGDPYYNFEELVQTFYTSYFNRQKIESIEVVSVDPLRYYYYGRGHYFTNYFIGDSLEVNNNDYVHYKAFYGSLEINNENFYDVKVITGGFTFYWAKNIGLIRAELPYSNAPQEYWKLKKYYINN